MKCHEVAEQGGMMFRGRSKHTLDSKGRLAIPTRFKEALDPEDDHCLVVTNGQDCLLAYARHTWRAIEERASRLPEFDPKANVIRRYYVSGAEECIIKQGRIIISPYLKEVAGLNKEVVLVGQLKRFEIWDKDKWDKEFERVKEEFPEASQEFRDFGV